ncbi:MAG: Ig-like domain-containing protein, partial [Candidatus Latescibacterota bacterium]
MPGRSRRKPALVKMLVAVSAALACAVESPPPGGPVDDVAPTVVETVPKADSAGVDPSSPIAISFSEDMTRAGVERLFSMIPEIQIGKVSWDGRTIFIQPLEPLHPDTTYVARLKSGFRDNHKVPQENAHWWAFATSAAIDSGSISGTVFFRREPTRKGVARCFFLPVDSSFVPQASRPDRESTTNDAGKYSLRYLPNRGNGFIVWAFEDKNDNGEFD